MNLAKWMKSVASARRAIEDGKLDRALEILEKSLSIAEGSGNPDLRAESMTLLAMAYTELKDLDRALSFQNRVVAISSVFYGFDSDQHIDSLRMLAAIQFARKDYERAQATATTGMEILSNLNHDSSCGTFKMMATAYCILLAHICLKREDMAAASAWIGKYSETTGSYWHDIDATNLKKLELIMDEERELSMWDMIPLRIAGYMC